MMKKCIVFALLCVLLCSFAGCTSQKEPPTLTPTLDDAYVLIEHVHTASDGKVSEDSLTIQELTLWEQSAVMDHGKEPVTFTLRSASADTQSAVMTMDRPLMQGDAPITSVTVSRDQGVVLTSTDEDGTSDTFTLTMKRRDYRNIFAYLEDTDPSMTMCYGDGVLLTLYPKDYADHDRFYMTFAQEPALTVSGTYTLQEDTLTLCEDGGLSVLTFHRNPRRNAWQYDADASVRHDLAMAPAFADGMRLTFGFSYELRRDIRHVYEYRVTDFDGQTVLAEKGVQDKVRITPLSPTMLRIRVFASDTRTTYLNTQTGECSSSYHEVIADTPTCVVYMKNGQLTVEELGGDYTRRTYPTDAMGHYKQVDGAMVVGDKLTLRYRDADGKQRVGIWNWRTGETLPSCPLEIAAFTEAEPDDVRVLDESGTRFVGNAAVSRQCALPDGGELYYSGVSRAVILLDGEHRDVAWNEKRYLTLRLSGEVEEAEALKRKALTAAGLKARLQADVAAGLATSETLLDDAVTVYRYNNESRYHAVVFAEAADGLRVYVGDADATLRHLAGDTEGGVCIKIATAGS